MSLKKFPKAGNITHSLFLSTERANHPELFAKFARNVSLPRVASAWSSGVGRASSKNPRSPHEFFITMHGHELRRGSSV
jgi:hypothetical protein